MTVKPLRKYHIFKYYISLIFQSFYYPEHVGLRIGTDDTPRYIVMETHYDNPDHRDGMYNDGTSLQLIILVLRTYIWIAVWQSCSYIAI